MEYCRDCGKTTDNRKMMIFCECGGKLISERQYKQEQKEKCNHIIGLHNVVAGITQGYSLIVRYDSVDRARDSINFVFKYCPLCGNKTIYYGKEKK